MVLPLWESSCQNDGPNFPCAALRPALMEKFGFYTIPLRFDQGCFGEILLRSGHSWANPDGHRRTDRPSEKLWKSLDRWFVSSAKHCPFDCVQTKRWEELADRAYWDFNEITRKHDSTQLAKARLSLRLATDLIENINFVWHLPAGWGSLSAESRCLTSLIVGLRY